MVKDTTGTYDSQYLYSGDTTTWTVELMKNGSYVVALSSNDGAAIDIAVTTTMEETDVPDYGEVSTKPIVMDGVGYGFTSTGKVWYTIEIPTAGTVTITVEGDATVSYGLNAEALTVYEAPFTCEEAYTIYYILVESEAEATVVVNVEAPKGSTDNPYDLALGENVINVTSDTWYKLPINAAGTYTLTVNSADVSFGYGEAPYYQAMNFCTGETTYSFDANPMYMYYDGYYFMFNMPLTITVSYSAPVIEPEEPDIEIGEQIGSMEVETTDTYGYHDLYTYTAESAGQYTFFVPAGLGFYSKAQYDLRGDAEVGFYDNEAGTYFTVDLAAGEEYSFYVGATTVGTWTIDVYFYSTHTHTEVEIPAVLPTPSVTGYTAGVMCSECGEIIKAPVAINVTEMADTKDANFRIASASLSLGSNISVNYKNVLTTGYTNPHMVFVFEGEEYVVTEWTIDGDKYVFNFAEVGPHKIANNIEAYVYAETAEGEYSMNKILEYSIKQYCINQLKKNDAALTTVISDLLVVGAMTQMYEDEETTTDALITNVIEAAGYTLTPSTFESIPEEENVDPVVSGNRETGIDWKSASLLMGASTQLALKFEATSVEGLVVNVTIDGYTRQFTSEDFTMDGNRYVVTIDYLTAVQFNEVVTATFENADGEQVGSTITYSINAYLYRNVEKTSNKESARNLMKALYVYAKSVEAYFGK